MKALKANFKAVLITAICCSAFWMAIGIVCYRYIVNQRTKPIDREGQMMSGFYKREVKIKMDSISNTLIIQTLRNQLVEKQIEIDGLGEVLTTERSNRLDKSEYESDELMMFMNRMDHKKPSSGGKKAIES
ncbi:hypothetical protein [Ohtaekwangia koreensis]|uniref:Uncharacterized protein n=1 Tax=Ohtaekwangia koreensis TaxID=688867 RepID=A0A1T5MAX6_9BACT|nr:hypothetical protein [Ohtaekwangia koreensis]SKC85134.1 hypothetical protein SAMN05660236_4831 [Ohtaekwangia koreensis]